MSIELTSLKGLLVLGAVATLGFVMGKTSSGDEPQQLHAQTSAAQTAAQVQQVANALRTDIEELRRTLALHKASSSPVESTVGRGDSATAQSSTMVSRPAPAAAPQAIVKFQQADAVLTRAVGTGQWTDANAMELKTLMSEMNDEQREELASRVAQAVNSQQLKLNVGRGGPL